jgi:TfoX/Sxy family transcriptional regulator of competence genes
MSAERLFKVRERQRGDAPKATADYYAAQQALRDKTRELRQLRLARDAEKKHDSIG